MLEPSEALTVAAEISVSLTGFTGIVAVFGGGAVHEWDESDRFRLRLLLIASMSPLAMSLIALLLQSSDLAPSLVWRLVSAMAIAGLLLSAGDNLRTFRRIGVVKMNATPGSNVVFLLSSLASLAIGVLQFVNVVYLAAFWPFFTDVVFLMLLALLQFARLVLLRPQIAPRSTDTN